MAALALGAVTMMGASVVRADDSGDAAAAPESPPPLGGVIPGLDYTDQTANMVKDWFAKYGIAFGAGVSASYQFGFTKPSSDKLSNRLLDKDHDNFSVDLAQITLHKDATTPGDWGFMFQPITGRYSRRYKSDWNGSGRLGDTSWERKELEVQQAYLSYDVPVGNGIQVKLGKFNTLVGSEVNEPWANSTYSRQLIYNNVQPATHTGGLLSYQFNDMFSLTVGGITGWDVVKDNNNVPSFIGQVGFTPHPMETLYVGAIYGPEKFNNHKDVRVLFDVVNIFKPFDGFSATQNLDVANEDHVDINDNGGGQYWGVSNTFAYDFTPRLTGAFRQEFFNDKDGARTGIDQSIWELTTDIKFKLTDYMYIRGEYRHDESSRRTSFVHKTNGTLPGQDTLAWEIGYAF